MPTIPGPDTAEGLQPARIAPPDGYIAQLLIRPQSLDVPRCVVSPYRPILYDSLPTVRCTRVKAARAQEIYRRRTFSNERAATRTGPPETKKPFPIRRRQDRQDHAGPLQEHAM